MEEEPRSPHRALVVIPTYEERSTILEALRRLQEATGGSVDVLVVDDASPDGTAALDTYGALSAGKPAAAVAPTLGVPGSLPSIGAEVPPSILKKSVI